MHRDTPWHRIPWKRKSARRSSVYVLACSLATLPMLLAGCGAGVFSAAGGDSGTGAAVAAARGPQLGYFWRTTDSTLRPILGIPGSSQIGAAVTSPGAYVTALASATRGFGIAQAPDGSFAVLTLPAGTAAALPLTMGAPATLRLSPRGNAALAFVPGGTAYALITGLPAQPQVSRAAASAALLDAAVSDSGAVALASAQGSAVALQVAGAGGVNMVGRPGALGGLTFVPGGTDLLFADSAAGSLTLVTNAGTSPNAGAVNTGGLLKAPQALGISPGGRWLLLVNSASAPGAGSLVRVDLSRATAPQAVSCACDPTEAAAVADEGTFRITSSPTATNWLVDAVPATARTLFIPPLV